MSLDVYLTTKTERCAHCNRGGESVEHYGANITHNLAPMAREAGIYQHCWRPEEIGITRAKQLIEPLRKAVTLMKSDRPRFEKHNSKNGWGLYENFVPWLERYLAACEEYPESEIEVSL